MSINQESNPRSIHTENCHDKHSDTRVLVEMFLDLGLGNVRAHGGGVPQPEPKIKYVGTVTRPQESSTVGVMPVTQQQQLST